MTSDQNNGGTATPQPLVGTGTYVVAPNGRTTLTLVSGSCFQNSQPVLYLVTTNQAFIIGTDSAVSFGFMTPQVPPSGQYVRQHLFRGHTRAGRFRQSISVCGT